MRSTERSRWSVFGVRSSDPDSDRTPNTGHRPPSTLLLPRLDRLFQVDVQREGGFADAVVVGVGDGLDAVDLVVFEDAAAGVGRHDLLQGSLELLLDLGGQLFTDADIVIRDRVG